MREQNSCKPPRSRGICDCTNRSRDSCEEPRCFRKGKCPTQKKITEDGKFGRSGSKGVWTMTVFCHHPEDFLRLLTQCGDYARA